MPADFIYGVPRNADTIPLTRGMITRVASEGGVVRAQANTSAGVQGLYGVVSSGSSGVGGAVDIISAAGAPQAVLLETGLTPHAGDVLYISATVAGRATNVAPGIAVAIGVVVFTAPYARTSTVLAVIDTPVPAATAPLPANLVAQWARTGARVFALDGVNGNDSFLGYADSADTTQANVALATQAAGLVAKKTWAALAAIIPPIGNGRTALIVVNNANASTGGTTTYTDRFDAIALANGYTTVAIRATGTSTTAGATAFSGSSADLAYQGGVTATGMNATGYTVNSGGTSDTVQLTKVGGGSPAFPAETAKPYFVRARFDSATTTAGLRNVAYPVVEVIDAQTLRLGKLFTFAAGDLLYLEDQGVVFSDTNTQAFNQVETTFLIQGVSFGGALQFTRANATLVWVQTPTSGSISATDGRLNIFGQTSAGFIGVPNGTTTGSVGPTRTGSVFYTVSSGTVGIRAPNVAFVGGALGTTGGFTASASPALTGPGTWCGIGGDLTINGSNGASSIYSALGQTINPGIVGGSNVGTSGYESPLRVLGTIYFVGTRTTVGSIKLPSTSAAFGIRIIGTNELWFVDKVYGGTKTNAGFDTEQSRNSRIVYSDGSSSVGQLITGTNGGVYFGKSAGVSVNGIYSNLSDMLVAADALLLPNGDIWTRSQQTTTDANSTGNIASVVTFVGNGSGSPITGQRLIRTGAPGDSNSIQPLKADSAATIDGAIGYLVSTLPNTFGSLAIFSGVVPITWDVNAGGGAAAWVSPINTGQVTNTKPIAPNKIRQVGWSVGEFVLQLTPDNQAV